jgi:hypothetical protein
MATYRIPGLEKLETAVRSDSSPSLRLCEADDIGILMLDILPERALRQLISPYTSQSMQELTLVFSAFAPANPQTFQVMIE